MPQLETKCGDASYAPSAALSSLRDRLGEVAAHVFHAAASGKLHSKDVHELRVAIRRSIAAINLYRELLHKRPRKDLVRSLKQLLRNAGQIRDLDVFASRYQKSKVNGRRLMLKKLIRKRSQSERRLSELCFRLREEDRLSRRIDQLLSRLSQIGSSEEQSKLSIHSRWLLILNAFSQSPTENTSDLKSLHRFRIHVKKLRYTMELLESALVQEYQHMTWSIIAELQERLGNIHDQCVALQFLGEWKRKSKTAKKGVNLKSPERSTRQRLRKAISEFKSWWTIELKTELLKSLSIDVATT
jgi:CHAD domain-containing protein